ncbi:hypothetical protein CAC42_168 [Sphaceloma murrayae]|uniref:Uncharacterized protein n=1 Tax=Sphaceloma murrayae TaxID=2082308 RepID=A0A2K1QMR3_9PEZI|nr:hypothetical protein CAC42_168 [Sphaceloma murrayae]
MLLSTFANFVLSATLTASVPLTLPTAPTTVAVDWYQGPLTFPDDYLTSTTGSCGTKVASGTLTAGACNNFKVLGLGIQQNPHQDCKVKLWKDVTTCDGDGQWIEVVIPQGSETTCLRTGVLDGGRFYKASGVYSCFD